MNSVSNIGPACRAWLWLLTGLGSSLAGTSASAAPPVQAPAESEEARAVARASHWAFQPIRRVAIPTPPAGQDAGHPQHPIDAFLSPRLRAAGLGAAPEASQATLLRRLSFDLIGLPPTPAELDAFVQDASPAAYEHAVDRLLASPRYGERWGRHWLDIVRYTESQGFEYDKLRDQAWHYRDYVIESFNADKPYHRFMMEQVAGDVLEPVTTESIVGASLLVCGSWDEAGNSQANQTQKAITREEEMEDLLSVVGQTFLGLTVNCARCHAHKFDPIPQEDYYRLKAVFDGVKHGERPIAPPREVQARKARLDTLKRDVAALEKELAEIEGAGRKAAGRGTNITTEEMVSHLTEDQRRERGALLGRLEKARAEAAAVPALPVSYAGTRLQPPPTRRLKRGDVKSPEETVTPAALSALTELSPDLGLAEDAPEGERRLRFAAWLADPRNPLPARVMANRLWQFHFGQGLVATPSDFGVAGARPSHPELLDWLAGWFIDQGWSVKALHRLIVTSAAYRRSSAFDERAARVDADNQLLWRYAPRRLEAEVLRDAMLAASGEINFQAGGPSVRPFEVQKFPANAYVPIDKLGAEFNRRSVYRMNVNSGKEPLLDAFDCPDPSVKTPRRGVTTTPLQALGLMNNSFVQRQAAQLAARAWREAHQDLPAAVGAAYRHALGRSPTGEEAGRATAAARERSLTNVCWALLNSTEFVYVQ
jgi:hypothetical protein